MEPTIDANDAIAWPFGWGQWLVNANAQANAVTIIEPDALMRVVPRDASARFDPSQSQPLTGAWDWFALVEDAQSDGGANSGSNSGVGSVVIDLAAFSQAILVDPALVQRPGDANRDGLVTFADFSILQNHFSMPGSFEDGDFNGDGNVTFADFAILQNELSATPSLTPEWAAEWDHAPINGWRLTDVVVVPAPAARAVLTLPLLAMWLVVRRRKAKFLR